MSIFSNISFGKCCSLQFSFNLSHYCLSSARQRQSPRMPVRNEATQMDIDALYDSTRHDVQDSAKRQKQINQSTSLESSSRASKSRSLGNRTTSQSYIPPAWQNPWDQIRIMARRQQDDPHIRALECHIIPEDTRKLVDMDPEQHTISDAVSILEAKIKHEMQLQYMLLGAILAVDARQRDKSYQGMLLTRAFRYTRRINRWRWDKIFKASNDREGSRVQTEQIEDETAPAYHLRILYASVVTWLQNTDEMYQSIEDGWPKCKYVTEKVLQELVPWTAELWEERDALEKVYLEHDGKPPAFYESSWSGPLKEND